MIKALKSVAAPAAPAIYRHASRAEWGLGVIVEENAVKVYLAFEDGHRRPFLNSQRYRALLVPAVLTADAVAELVARIVKGPPKPAKARAKKPAVARRAVKAAAPRAERDDDGFGEVDPFEGSAVAGE